MVGFRVPYTYVPERAWKKANTVAGILFITSGLILMAGSYSLRPEYVVILTIALALAITFTGTLIAKREAEFKGFKEPEKDLKVKPLKPLNVLPYVLVSSILSGLCIAIIICTYSELPEIMAVHFGVAGKPDSFAEKAVILPVSPVIMTAITLLMFAFREPVFRGSIIEPKNPEKLAKAVLYLLLTVNALLLVNFADMIWYNLKGIFYVEIPLITLAVVILQVVRLIKLRF